MDIGYSAVGYLLVAFTTMFVLGFRHYGRCRCSYLRDSEQMIIITKGVFWPACLLEIAVKEIFWKIPERGMDLAEFLSDRKRRQQQAEKV